MVRRLGIGFVAYSPLGRGFLGGKIRKPEDFAPDDRRKFFPRFQGENFPKNLEVLERVEEIAKARKVEPAELALAWVLAQGADVVPLFGTKRRSFLESNVNATNVQLTSDELGAIDRAAPKGSAAGDRYPDMSSVNR
jgi:aryl-alcohol dehydrogenase-like predicted oxidoreductase